MKITFTKSDLDVMRLDAVDLLRETHYTHWENTLRTFFDEHECGTPTPETLRNHGRWLIPHPSQTRGLLHKLFQWRGQIVFEGWADIATGRHVIHPHTADTPKPWGTPKTISPPHQ